MASPHDLPGLYPAHSGCARRTESVRLVQPLYPVHRSCTPDTAAVRGAHRLCVAYSVCTRRTARVHRAAASCAPTTRHRAAHQRRLIQLGVFKISYGSIPSTSSGQALSWFVLAMAPLRLRPRDKSLSRVLRINASRIGIWMKRTARQRPIYANIRPSPARVKLYARLRSRNSCRATVKQRLLHDRISVAKRRRPVWPSPFSSPRTDKLLLPQTPQRRHDALRGRLRRPLARVDDQMI
jgi:hypothetical protein